MAVGRGLQVDGCSQVKALDDCRWAKIERVVDALGQFVVGHGACAEGFCVYGDGVRHTDGVGDLDFAALGQAGCDHGFGDVAGGVCCGAVYFAWVFTGERAAAVTCVSAVCVDDDFASGESAVASGAADDEAPCWVDVKLCVLI